MRRTLEVLGARGGSHTGDLQVERKRGGVCPRCPTVELRRDDVGGRTTYWCADCQT
jgi:formamidopyrimidine-DNA glycosylase